MTLYSEAARPTLEEIDAYAHTPLWPQLRAYLAAAYGAGPRLEYSRCGLEPGWNVKFRRGSKSLCTVYLPVSYTRLPAAWVCDGHGFCRAQG